MAEKKKWIGTLKKGGLHKSLGIAQGKKIPMKRIEAAAKRSGKVGRQARTAETLEHLRPHAKVGRDGRHMGHHSAHKAITSQAGRTHKM